MADIHIVGLGLSTQDLSPRHREIIGQADILVGGKRLLALFDDHPAEKIAITKNLKGVVATIKAKASEQTVVVLASGDPLFFGIGSLLKKELGAEQITIHPNISSVAAAFARIKEPWQDAVCLSLHGRDRFKDLLDALERSSKVAVLTDPRQNPGWLASRLMARSMVDLKLWVFEQLGTPDERIGCFTLQQAAERQFSQPNLVIILRTAAPAGSPGELRLGTPDAWFAYEKGLITKAEVRVVSLSKLALKADDVVWDLGAGSGSVALEAARLVPSGQVYALEKNSRRIEWIKANRDRFGIPNLEIKQCRLPEGLSDLPQPQAVFIGGGGEGLSDILAAAITYLGSGGRVVVNTVLLQSLTAAVEILESNDMEPEVIHIQVSRHRKMPFSMRMEAQNPVWIISSRKR